MENKAVKRILYADVLRIMTIFVVVLFHVVTDRWYGCFDNPSEWYVLNFFVAGLRWCVPVFFMLSGMNILDPARNVTYKKLFTKSLPRLLCALVFWSITYKLMGVATNYFMGLKPVTMDNVIEAFTVYLFQIPWYHLWFLYPLIGMYLLAPAIRLFTKSATKKDVAYLLLLYFIFAWLLPMVYAYVGRGIAIDVSDLLPYTGYFIAGYFFAKFDLTKFETRLLYIAGGACLILTIGLHFLLCLLEGGSQYHEFFYYKSANIAIAAFFVFVLVKNLVNNSQNFKAKYQDNKYITLLAECSFGIYLTHVIFLNIFGALLNINTGSFSAILSVPFLSISTFFLSLGFTMLIKKIPVLGKWIV